MLYSDNGSPMKGATMLETLYGLGITPSKSRPRVSNDNPYAESLFKTLKYVPNFQPQGFGILTEARLWVKRFVEWYNKDTELFKVVNVPMQGTMKEYVELAAQTAEEQKEYFTGSLSNDVFQCSPMPWVRDIYIDLLLFHRRLRSLVAIELKIGEFEAEYAGKMQLYLTALDEQVKLPDENPSIGIIICKSKDKTFVEYALKQSNVLIGVATY